MKQADKITSEVKPDGFIVSKLEEKERIKRPNATPLNGLQQETSNKLGFYTKKTMLIAQQLYEGMEIKGHGTVGLVTYIKTDSVRVSDEAEVALKSYIMKL